jgi:hypothetical protein
MLEGIELTGARRRKRYKHDDANHVDHAAE